MPDARWVISTVVLAGYLLAARGAGSLYPISTFPMFSESAGQATSRIMARTAAGEFAEVSAFDSWRCDNLPHLDLAACSSASGAPYIAPGAPYIDREREDYIRAHAGSGGESLELVRRVFTFTDDGVQPRAYCAIARCTAKRR